MMIIMRDPRTDCEGRFFIAFSGLRIAFGRYAQRKQGQNLKADC